jgi:GNAT superfamily N-acetyltransferase
MAGTESGLEPHVEDIHFRSISPEDWHRLQLFHKRLSEQTVRRRFHGAKRGLSEPLAHRFTELDGQNDVAIVATTGTRGRIIGVARYCRMSPTSAEVAFVIEDEYQHRGIGRRLMRRLRATALQNGITQFVAEVLPGNMPMLHLLHEVGPAEVHLDQGVYEVRVELTKR